MTEWETHRTETEFENSFIIKSFAFQSVNSYISFFYIAFLRARSANVFSITYTDIDGNQKVF